MDDSTDYNLDHYQSSYEFLKVNLPIGYKIYNYSYSEFIQDYSLFYEFVYVNIRDKWNDFNINPCYFYYIETAVQDGRQIKAYAENNGKFNVIGIYFELFEKLRLIFKQHLPSLAGTIDVKKYDVRNRLKMPIDYLMHQISMRFLYYHELAHVIQGANNSEFYISEDIDTQIKDNQKILTSHIKETDADLFAANFITDDIINFWQQSQIDKYSHEILETIITMSLVGIFLTFDYLSKGIRELYFLETTHPHEIVRITLISGIVHDKIRLHKRLNLNREKITRRTFEHLYAINKDKAVMTYLGSLRYHHEIQNYVQFINKEGFKYPNLASFQMAKRI